ncbi:MAG: nucleoside kinase, partial [Chloroflexota bacterium]
MVIKSTAPITVSEPRTTIRVTMSSGTVLEAPIGTTIHALLTADRAQNPAHYDSDAMGGVLNGRLRELAYPVKADANLKPVLFSSSDGSRIHRRTLTLLLTTAVDELFPGVKVDVQYSIPEGGYYCVLRNREPFTPDELHQLEDHMHAIVTANEPIIKAIKPLKEALDIFEARHADDKLRLLEQRSRDNLVVYTLRVRTDYYYGYMLPSTGLLKQFGLMHADEGFILTFPRSENPNTMKPIRPDTQLAAVFRETNRWLQRMGVEDIGRLNKITRDDRVQELILVAEALHEQRIAYIAGDICKRHTEEGVRIVLIAGPTSAGKTTFSKRLAVQLLAYGLRPFTLELDNYFVDREKTPLDENGEYDFESLGTLNITRFNRDLLGLTSGKLVQLPKFNFITGKSEDGMQAQLTENQVIILEGIHGLNPGLVPDIPESAIHRVYVS